MNGFTFFCYFILLFNLCILAKLYDKWLVLLLQPSCASPKAKTPPSYTKYFLCFNRLHHHPKMLILDRGHLFNKFSYLQIFFLHFILFWCQGLDLCVSWRHFFHNFHLLSYKVQHYFYFLWLIYYSCFNLHQWLSTPKDFFVLL